MQLVLLSGGSGKRLWPFSNDTRSKQFLPLLEKEEDSMESMVQRVVRQIREAELTNEITIATNSSQLGVITNQLGEEITIVTEPERRDTFPAIALAASYLKLVKGCPDDEVIAIMPCDPYTEPNYFKTINNMVQCVQKGVAELVLMGITPTYPSEKYGYIIPIHEDENAMGFRKVLKFTEKPSAEKAKILLKENAYWNGGVFAFRLDFIMNIVHKYIVSNSFEHIRNHYSEFPKISFDYEVVEKAKSVAMVPFTGKWKDLGTWNTLTAELHKNIFGNAILGSHCMHTHIINELQIPIYAEGLKNIIVAACPDGILVCEKKHTENIKKVVEDLQTSPMYEEEVWGTSQILDLTKDKEKYSSLVKKNTLKPGKQIPYHAHNHSETWTFIQGEGIFVLNGTEQKVEEGDTVIIPANHWHAIRAITSLTFIEVQSGKPLISEKSKNFK